MAKPTTEDFIKAREVLDAAKVSPAQEKQTSQDHVDEAKRCMSFMGADKK